MVRQEWRDVTFLHWQLQPDAVAALVPEPLQVDTFDDAAWVTVTPFSTTCEFAGVAPVPGPRRFPETNVRTYVRGPDGGDGLLFLSLDVTNRANALLGRCLNLPYHVSAMTIEDGSTLRYVGNRGDPREAGYAIAVVPGDPIEPTPLDIFLTGRWSAYVAYRRLVVRYDVEHEPWPLQDAAVIECEQTLVRAAGLDVTTPTAAHFSPGVSARLAPARGTCGGASAQQATSPS